MRQTRTVGLGWTKSRHRSIPAWALIAAVAWALGCGPSSTTAALGGPDAPVPPGEPRAELRLAVDLPPAQDCEEAFDLAMYQDRGIELIEWDDAKGSCEGRTILVRYLPRKLSAAAVRQAAGSHAVRARPAPPPPKPKPTKP